DLDGLALLDALHDRLGQEIEHLIGLFAVHATRFCELRHQLRLRHRSTSIPGWVGTPRTAEEATIYGSRKASVKKTRAHQGLARYSARRSPWENAEPSSSRSRRGVPARPLGQDRRRGRGAAQPAACQHDGRHDRPGGLAEARLSCKTAMIWLGLAGTL